MRRAHEMNDSISLIRQPSNAWAPISERPDTRMTAGVATAADEAVDRALREYRDLLHD